MANYMNATIMKTQIIHFMKYDLECHSNTIRSHLYLKCRLPFFKLLFFFMKANFIPFKAIQGLVMLSLD